VGGFKHQVAICMREETVPVVFILFPFVPHFFLLFFFFSIPVEVNNCMVLCWAISLFLAASICRIELPFKHK